MTNCSLLSRLPPLEGLASLQILDLENCTSLAELPRLPGGLDSLVISGCEALEAGCKPLDVDGDKLAELAAAASQGADVASERLLQRTADAPASATASDSSGVVRMSSAALARRLAELRSPQEPRQQAQRVQQGQAERTHQAGAFLQALPHSLTEVQAAGCPLFAEPAARAALAAFLVSNRLLQWERFREPDAFASLQLV